MACPASCDRLAIESSPAGMLCTSAPFNRPTRRREDQRSAHGLWFSPEHVGTEG
jgi:hypothetical protein